MKVKNISENFNDYKKSSLTISTCYCDFKCEKENLCKNGMCQNSKLYKEKDINISDEKIISIFNNSLFIESIVFGGLEPFLQFDELIGFIKEFRKTNENDIVIYSGYTEKELQPYIERLKEYKNIIIKVGRFIENSKPRFDNLLGINLASKNQYAIKIS